MAFVFLFGNQWVTLWDQDEAAYAGFARRMVESGNWLIPEFMWSDVHRKPPLHFWSIALSYKALGVNEFATRVPSALSVLFTLAATYFMGRRLFGEKESFIGMVVLSTSFLVMALAKISVTDATLLFFTTVCALSILYVLVFEEKRWIFVFWTSFALALLVKGPPVILFTGVFVFLLFVFHPQRKKLFRLHPWFFLPLAVAPLYIWGWLCFQNQEGKDFIYWMVDWYILKRVGGSVFGQTGPPGTHLVGLMVFFLPYFMFFPKAVFNGIRHLFTKSKNADFLLAAWFVAGWFIFELTPSKLPAYVVAAHVPLALIIGRLLLNHSQNLPNRGLVAGHLVLNGLIFLIFMIAPFAVGLSASMQWVFGAGGLFFLIFLILTIRKARRENFMSRLLVMNVSFAVALGLVFLPVADQLKNSSLRIARYVETIADSDTPVVIANNFTYPPSLPFYLMERFSNVGEEYDVNTLIEMYKSSEKLVFILNTERRNAFAEKFPELNYVEIKPLFTDRIPQESYFIITNIRPDKAIPENEN
ncbi:MAG: ArnT family glycosyltransferase [Cytophagaceae bacterium]